MVRKLLHLTDAGYANQGEEKKIAQEVPTIEIAYRLMKGNIFQILVWFSKNQRCVSITSIQAETIAAVTRVKYTLHFQQVLRDITGKNLLMDLVRDSVGPQKTLATQVRPKDMNTINEIHSLRLECDSGVIKNISWVPGKIDTADALTKMHARETTGMTEELLPT